MDSKKSTRRSSTDVRNERTQHDNFLKNLTKLRKEYLVDYARTVNVKHKEDDNMAEIKRLILKLYKNAHPDDKPTMLQFLTQEISEQVAAKIKKGKGRGKAKGKEVVMENRTLGSSRAPPMVPEILIEKMLEQIQRVIRQHLTTID